MAYYQLEPFGEERADARAALIASTLVNTHRDPKKGRSARIEDFMFRFDEEERTDDDMLLAKVAQMNAALGGLDRRNERGDAGEP